MNPIAPAQSSRLASRWSIAYFGLFLLATFADLVTTQIGLNMGKSELNPVVNSVGAGLASPRAWAMNIAFAALCTGLVWMSFPRIMSVAPNIGEFLRPANLHSFRSDKDLRSVQYLYSALMALVMRALPPISNLASIAFGTGLPKAVRLVFGTGVSNSAVLLICIALSATLASIVAVPLVRVVARHLLRQNDLAEDTAIADRRQNVAASPH